MLKTRVDHWADWTAATVEYLERVRNVAPDLDGERLVASDPLRLSRERDFEPMALSEGGRA